MALVWPFKVQSCHARCVLLVAGRHGDFDITARCSCHCGPSMLILRQNTVPTTKVWKHSRAHCHKTLFYKGHLEVSDTSALIPKACSFFDWVSKTFHTACCLLDMLWSDESNQIHASKTKKYMPSDSDTVAYPQFLLSCNKCQIQILIVLHFLSPRSTTDSILYTNIKACTKLHTALRRYQFFLQNSHFCLQSAILGTKFAFLSTNCWRARCVFQCFCNFVLQRFFYSRWNVWFAEQLENTVNISAFGAAACKRHTVGRSKYDQTGRGWVEGVPSRLRPPHAGAGHPPHLRPTRPPGSLARLLPDKTKQKRMRVTGVDKKGDALTPSCTTRTSNAT